MIVAVAHRGRGLARQIVAEALRLGASLGPELAMLFCLPSRAGLYERLGFSAIEPPVLVQQPDGPLRVDLVVHVAHDSPWRGSADRVGASAHTALLSPRRKL